MRSVTRSEIANHVEAIFRCGPVSRAEILSAVLASGARTEVIALLEGLSERRYLSLPELWADLPAIPLAPVDADPPQDSAFPGPSQLREVIDTVVVPAIGSTVETVTILRGFPRYESHAVSALCAQLTLAGYRVHEMAPPLGVRQRRSVDLAEVPDLLIDIRLTPSLWALGRAAAVQVPLVTRPHLLLAARGGTLGIVGRDVMELAFEDGSREIAVEEAALYPAPPGRTGRPLSLDGRAPLPYHGIDRRIRCRNDGRLHIMLEERVEWTALHARYHTLRGMTTVEIDGLPARIVREEVQFAVLAGRLRLLKAS